MNRICISQFLLGAGVVLVSCPDFLLHAEKDSGEMRIQFWFPMYARDVL